MNRLGGYRVGTIATVCAVLLGLFGCLTAESFENTGKKAVQPPESPQPIAIQPETKQSSQKPVVSPKKVNSKLLDANTRFGFKLFSEILKEKRGKNTFVSPSSVAIALSMTYNGASGSTQQAMARALELRGMSLQEINQANAGLKQVLENPDPQVQLAIANSLWARQGIPFKPEFLQRNKTFYNAEVASLDFADPAAKDTINNWVKQNTQGKIDKIIDQIKADQVMFLINAIYFKGQWSEKFDKSATAPAPFYLAGGKSKQHPLMSQTGDYRYFENEQFQAVSLPYGAKQRISMYIFLPKPKSNLDAFYKNLSVQSWNTWISQFGRRQGSIKIPRFKLEDELQLNKALKALGMAEAFDRDRANFSALSSEPMSIDEVKHKTFVEVNEEGTEAAAVTSIGVVATSAQIPQEPFNMVVDRPFFCAIRDNQTGTILFMGSIVDP
jgi:serine protease inhibitor